MMKKLTITAVTLLRRAASRRVLVSSILLLTFFPALLASAQNVSQDSSAQQKDERCQTNRRELERLEEEAKKLEADLWWTDERIALARTQLAAVRRIIARFLAGHVTGEDMDKLYDISGKYEYKWDTCVMRASTSFCAAALERELAGKVTSAIASRRRGPQVARRKREVERQISFHKRRMAELG